MARIVQRWRRRICGWRCSSEARRLLGCGPASRSTAKSNIGHGSTLPDLVSGTAKACRATRLMRPCSGRSAGTGCIHLHSLVWEELLIWWQRPRSCQRWLNSPTSSLCDSLATVLVGPSLACDRFVVDLHCLLVEVEHLPYYYMRPSPKALALLDAQFKPCLDTNLQLDSAES